MLLGRFPELEPGQPGMERKQQNGNPSLQVTRFKLFVLEAN